MSNYDQWRDTHNFSRSAIDTGSAGSGLLWLFVAVAVLGVLVLVGSLGGGTTATQHPGGAEAIAVPTEQSSGASSTGAEAAGTVPID